MPEAVANASSAPSIAAIRSSNIRTVRVPVARIDEFVLAGLLESLGSLFGTLVDKALSQENRFGDFPVLASSDSSMHELRALFQSSVNRDASSSIPVRTA